MLSRKKFMFLKDFRSEKNVGSEKMLSRKKFMFPKNFRSEKNVGSEKNLGATIRFLVCSVIVDFGVVLLVLLVTLVIWTPKLSQKPMIGLFVKFQPSSTPPSDRFW